jgi:hypothetical protein
VDERAQRVRGPVVRFLADEMIQLLPRLRELAVSQVFQDLLDGIGLHRRSAGIRT